MTTQHAGMAGQAQYGPPGGGQWIPRPVTVAKTNGLAVASMVLGIVWLSWLGSLPAVSLIADALG